MGIKAYFKNIFFGDEGDKGQSPQSPVGDSSPWHSRGALVNEGRLSEGEASPADETDETDIGWYTLEEIAQRYSEGGGALSPSSAFARIGTVFACVDRRATTLAKLPFQVFVRQGDKRMRAEDCRIKYLLEVRPNRFQSPMAYKKYIITCQLLWGFAIIYKKLMPNGEIDELIPWNPTEVTVHQLTDKTEYVYGYKGEFYTEEEVIYIPYLSADGKRGKAPMTVARESAEAVGLMTKHLGNMYKSGAIKQGALTTQNALSGAAKMKLKKQWAELYGGFNNSGEPAVLDNGLGWTDISLPFSDLQFIESRRLTALEIAAIFNVPGSSVGLSQEKYTNLQEINDRFLQDVVAPDCINIEEAHNFSCFLPSEKNYYTKFNLAAGMRGTPEKRAEFYRELFYLGAININEIRAREDWDGIGELGDKFYITRNLATLEEMNSKIEDSGK